MYRIRQYNMMFWETFMISLFAQCFQSMGAGTPREGLDLLHKLVTAGDPGGGG